MILVSFWFTIMPIFLLECMCNRLDIKALTRAWLLDRTGSHFYKGLDIVRSLSCALKQGEP